MPKPIMDRFMEKVEFDTNGGCWLWAAKTDYGYGRFSVGYKSYRAHRFSYQTFVGEIPEGILVCHRCDIPPCCNPDHLFLGTDAENVADMIAKDRSPRGRRHPMATLSETDIADIRASKERGAHLARMYGVSRTTVCDILKRRTWSHIQ